MKLRNYVQKQRQTKLNNKLNCLNMSKNKINVKTNNIRQTKLEDKWMLSDYV